MIFGYARVSKNEQSLDIQLKKLKNYSCDEIYQEKISGIREDRSELNKLLERLRKGDKIVVQRLDRLGRRMSKLIELINNFKEKEIEFVALENNIDTSNPMGMLLFSICAAFSFACNSSASYFFDITSLENTHVSLTRRERERKRERRRHFAKKVKRKRKNMRIIQSG